MKKLFLSAAILLNVGYLFAAQPPETWQPDEQDLFIAWIDRSIMLLSEMQHSLQQAPTADGTLRAELEREASKGLVALDCARIMTCCAHKTSAYDLLVQAIQKHALLSDCYSKKHKSDSDVLDACRIAATAFDAVIHSCSDLQTRIALRRKIYCSSNN